MFILIAILIFGLLIFIHELGHFIAARICGVHVLEFAIGMGPKIFSVKSKKSGTVYSIRLFPMGGFVSMLGENGMETVQGDNGENETTENSILINKEIDEKEAEPKEEIVDSDPRSYSNQSVWKRIFISIAGPFMNVFLGFLMMLVVVFATATQSPLGSTRIGAFNVVYSAEEAYGELETGDYIYKVDGVFLQSYSQLSKMVEESETGLFSIEVLRLVGEGAEESVENIIFTDVYLNADILAEKFDYSLSEKTGLRLNDQVIKVNSTSVHTQNELAYEMMNQGYDTANEPLTLTVIRNGETVVLDGIQIPNFEDSGAVFGNIDFKVWPEQPVNGHETMPSFGVLLKHAWFRSVSTVKMVYDSLIGLFSGRFGVEAVSGPIGITKTVATVAKTGFLNVLYLVVIISINLGIMNLLPFPGLDGGHLMIYAVEVVRRKPMKKELEGTINFIGLLILLALAVLIAIKDIINL
ncbi:MAG: RIP metalloprotease RseP [Ruminococcaceae bacterium]|nr:RIP metalloprotease RseP [Oscillospiraceae bacterium]